MRHAARIPRTYALGATLGVAVGAPVGFAQVFPGWNVWSLWQADDQELGVVDTLMLAGLSNERRMRIWVEDWVRLKDPAAEVAKFETLGDAGALKGDAIDVIPNAGGLQVLQTRADIPGLAGEQQRGEQGSAVTRWTVRFYNRAKEPSAVAWPTDENYLLEEVYQPATDNPITNAPPPRSSIEKAAEGLGEVVKVVAIVGGVALGAVLLTQLVQAGRSRRSTA